MRANGPESVLMLNQSQQFGKKSETIAVKHLKKQKYKILEENYRTRLGEIDIIAKDGDTIAFIEVKSRRSDQFGHPKWAITPQKQRKISMVALQYLKSTGQSNARARFDVISISLIQNKPEIELLKNAFETAFE